MAAAAHHNRWDMPQQAAAPSLSAWQCGGALGPVEGAAEDGCLQVPGSAALM